jgi:adenine-specific DNA-methyltransferase
MARIDDLISQVSDESLRTQFGEAVAELRRRKRFGLVYEEHIPETVALASEVGVRPGVEVMLRHQPEDRTRYVVTAVSKQKATISDGEITQSVKRGDLLVLVPFGEPIYPVLRPAEIPVVRSADKPFHTVVNGENYHALKLLLFTHELSVDAIYIDPPYNTGDRSWKYSNDYVDSNDTWQHSKWLSFMEKRLTLAKRLLKPDGVLVVTIDEHEVHHLGVLLGQIFPECRRPMITIVINSAGNTQGGFYRVEEHAIFCFPPGVSPDEITDDLLSDESSRPRGLWSTHIRSGGINDLPSKRPNLVYPVAIDPATGRIAQCGPSLDDRMQDPSFGIATRAELDDWLPDPKDTLEGLPVIWPYSRTGKLGTWRNGPETLLSLAETGYIRVRRNPGAPGANEWSLSYITEGHRAKIESGQIPVHGRDARDGSLLLGDMTRPVIPKTVWKRKLHDATNWGSPILRALVPDNGFNYPKSVYAVRDTLATIVSSKPDALVLDFFAGSGTTMHAVALLNAADGGRRRTILVTNNEVAEAEVATLRARGLAPGDPEWEAMGIAKRVTVPRSRAAITGLRADGSPVEGEYPDGTALAEGFEENAVFFDLVYEDPDRIEVGERFEDVLPALWLAAGSVGDPTSLKAGSEWFLADDIPFAVLLDEDRFTEFAKKVRARGDITHVWLVTDSTAAFARMCGRLPKDRRVGMLYRDYLRSFQINTRVDA